MADLTDVAAALVTACAAIIYPNGTGSASITGVGVRVYQGWPNAKQLADDLAAGKAHVSVYPQKVSKVTSVYQGDEDWEDDAGGTTVTRETRRETRQFQNTVWASCFDVRDPLAAALDAGLASLPRLTLADGSVATLSYGGSMQSDQSQKAAIYRRDLLYSVNYATLQTQAATLIQHTTTNTTAGPVNATGPTFTINT